MTPTPAAKESAANARRTTVGSIPRRSPIPPATPVITRSRVLRLRRLRVRGAAGTSFALVGWGMDGAVRATVGLQEGDVLTGADTPETGSHPCSPLRSSQGRTRVEPRWHRPSHARAFGSWIPQP